MAESWKAYAAAEERGIRREYLAALDTFLHTWAACQSDVRSAWVENFVERWVREQPKPPLRGPLLERAVLPHLAAEFRRGNAMAAAHLGHLRSSALGGHRSWDRLGLPTYVELLAEAYRRDPSLEDARRTLVDLHIRYIRYTLHELPTGVLFGVDGASAAECGELEDLVEELAQLMDDGETAEYAQLLGDARFHYRTYRNYLQQAERGGYQAYLELLERG